MARAQSPAFFMTKTFLIKFLLESRCRDLDLSLLEGARILKKAQGNQLKPDLVASLNAPLNLVGPIVSLFQKPTTSCWCCALKQNFEKKAQREISSKRSPFASLNAPSNLLFNISVSLLKTRNSCLSLSLSHPCGVGYFWGNWIECRGSKKDEQNT